MQEAALGAGESGRSEFVVKRDLGWVKVPGPLQVAWLPLTLVGSLADRQLVLALSWLWVFPESTLLPCRRACASLPGPGV